jgi:hypothetical protein
MSEKFHNHKFTSLTVIMTLGLLISLLSVLALIFISSAEAGRAGQPQTLQQGIQAEPIVRPGASSVLDGLGSYRNAVHGPWSVVRGPWSSAPDDMVCRPGPKQETTDHGLLTTKIEICLTPDSKIYTSPNIGNVIGDLSC